MVFALKYTAGEGRRKRGYPVIWWGKDLTLTCSPKIVPIVR
jgi:hypothetical protein